MALGRLVSASVRVPPSDTSELLIQINFQIVTLKVYRFLCDLQNIYLMYRFG